MMGDSIQRHSLWGQAFEIAVKRGVLAALLGSKVIKNGMLGLDPWLNQSTAEVYAALAQEFREVDQNLKSRTRETARHVFELGMGLGQTAMREYLRKLKYLEEDYALRALWCPLQLPRLKADFEAETQSALAAFHAAFALDGPIDERLADKGFPVRADFLIWLEPSHDSIDRELLQNQRPFAGFQSHLNAVVRQFNAEAGGKKMGRPFVSQCGNKPPGQ